MESDVPATTQPSGPEALSEVLRDYMNATERLQRTHEALQSEVARLRRELEHKDRELERRRRLACLGELAAGVAHEVRNPLGAIQLYSGLLRHECEDDRAALRLIEKIEAGIRAIDGVVQDTLALAPKNGKTARCAIREVIDSAYDVALRTLQERGVTLDVRPADPACTVNVDAAALERVLVNLIVNAAEASSPNTTIVLRVESERDGALAVLVSDQGAGLRANVLEKMFDPFFTTKQKGTGLGLTIAHRLIEAHGGTLAARNRAEGGAEFRIVLPAASDEDQGSAVTDDAGRTTAA